MGIYDPLLTRNVEPRAHGHADLLGISPARRCSPNDTWDAALGVTQLTPWGGTRPLGLVGNRDADEQLASSNVNPALPPASFSRHHPAAAAQLRDAPDELNI